MKIELITPDTIIINPELITCWSCDGTKESTRNTLCPLMWKSVRGLKGKNGKSNHCPHCDASNRHKHVTIGEYQVKCDRCNATGQIYDAQNSDSINKEIFDNLLFFFGPIPNKDAQARAVTFGMDSVHSVTDYGRFFNHLKANGIKSMEQMYALKLNAQSTGAEKVIYDYLANEVKFGKSINIDSLKLSNVKEEQPVTINRHIRVTVHQNGYILMAADRGNK